MKPWLLRLIVAAGAYAITLTVAALLLDRFRIDSALWFIFAVAVFTVATVILTPAVHRVVSDRYRHGATWLTGLVTTWLALLLADILARGGLEIEGIGTWILAVVIVWIGTIVYDVVEDRVITVAEARLQERQRPGRDA